MGYTDSYDILYIVFEHIWSLNHGPTCSVQHPPRRMLPSHIESPLSMLKSMSMQGWAGDRYLLSTTMYSLVPKVLAPRLVVRHDGLCTSAIKVCHGTSQGARTFGTELYCPFSHLIYGD